MEVPSSEEQPLFTGEVVEFPYETVIDDLAEKLGFIETKELSGLYGEVLGAHNAGDTGRVSSLIDRYYELGQELVNQKQVPQDRLSAWIGLIVAIATLLHKVGRPGDYLNNLYDALLYAISKDHKDAMIQLVAEIEAARESESE